MNAGRNAAESATLFALRWHFASVLREATGIHDERESEALAAVLVEALRAKFGGNPVYIPAIPAARRREQIREMFNGHNRDEVLKALRISKATFYRTLKHDKSST